MSKKGAKAANKPYGPRPVRFDLYRGIPKTKGGPAWVDRSRLVRWAADALRVHPWDVTEEQLRWACQAGRRGPYGKPLEISYRETKYVELSRGERQRLYQHQPLGSGEHAFVLFRNGCLRAPAWDNRES